MASAISTSPSHSAAPLCGQTLLSAKKRSPTRNTAMVRGPAVTAIAVPGGMSSILPTTYSVIGGCALLPRNQGAILFAHLLPALDARRHALGYLGRDFHERRPQRAGVDIAGHADRDLGGGLAP